MQEACASTIKLDDCASSLHYGAAVNYKHFPGCLEAGIARRLNVAPAGNARL
jgi:hypothetical protein